MNVTYSISLNSWVDVPSFTNQTDAVSSLEQGKVLHLQNLAFYLNDAEHRFLSPTLLQRNSKNISLDPQSNKISGAKCSTGDYTDLGKMMERFARQALSLIHNLLPRYAQAVVRGRTSFRPVETQGRVSSRRADDTLLHIDAFPSRPTDGWRILRVFSNVNCQSQDRVWHVGQPFEEVARKFLDTIPDPFFATASVLRLLGITKSRRTLYDHYMLQMHNVMKESIEYQSSIEHTSVCFTPDSTWIVFTDQVSHAAISGQHVLEQTFYLPVSAMDDEACSPLRILEKMKGYSLV